MKNQKFTYQSRRQSVLVDHASFFEQLEIVFSDVGQFVPRYVTHTEFHFPVIFPFFTLDAFSRCPSELRIKFYRLKSMIVTFGLFSGSEQKMLNYRYCFSLHFVIFKFGKCPISVLSSIHAYEGTTTRRY